MQALISEHPRNAKFVKRGNLVPLDVLPQSAQDALIHYMSVDGAAWAVEENWPDWKWGEGKPNTSEGRAEVMADIEKFRDRFLAKWGNEPFGYVEVPYTELVEAVNGDDYFVTSGGHYDYSNASAEYAIPTWPVILAAFADETLEDGWNRLAMYCKLKLPVPVVWFPDNWPSSVIVP